MGLIYFEGGPLDGTAYETKTLLGLESLNLPVIEYVWTSEKKTSEATGAVAALWRHRDLIDNPTPQPMAATLPQGQNVTEAERVAEVQVQEPVVGLVIETAVEQPVVQAAQEVLDGGQFDELGNDVAPDVQPAQPQPAAAAPSTGELPSGEQLLERRKALKASRADVSARSGLAQSKIGAIETGGGKRIKDEEIRVLADTITALEQEAAASAH